MARPSSKEKHNTKAGPFFMATLIMWAVSVMFEIVFDKRRELVMILAGFVFFQLTNWIVRFRLSRDPLVVNTCVSLLHSSIISVSVVLILLNRWKGSGMREMFEHSQLVEVTWPGAYAVLCFSSGYFAYDQMDMLVYRLYSGWFPSILVHHLLLLVCFTLALYRNITINYLILTLICELHSVFLHVRKIRRMAGVRDARNAIVKVEWAFNFVTFILARSLSHVLITMKLLKDSSKFGDGVELPLALSGMVGMNLLNLFLSVDLYGAYRREIAPVKNQKENHGSSMRN